MCTAYSALLHHIAKLRRRRRRHAKGGKGGEMPPRIIVVFYFIRDMCLLVWRTSQSASSGAELILRRMLDED